MLLKEIMVTMATTIDNSTDGTDGTDTLQIMINDKNHIIKINGDDKRCC